MGKTTTVAAEMTTLDEQIAVLDVQIAEAEAERDRLTEHWRNLGPNVAVDASRQGASYNPARRLAKLDAAIAVDLSMATVASLRAERVSRKLATVSDPGALASLEAAAQGAKAILTEGEAQVRQARSAYGQAQSALEGRQAAMQMLTQELTRHEGERASAEQSAAKLRHDLESLQQFSDMRAALAESAGA